MKTVFNLAESADSLPLCELELGEEARIAEWDARDATGRRLLDLGLVPGTPVTLIRRAPLGDPSVYELCGYQLCLRRSEAQHVRVMRTEPGVSAADPLQPNP